MSEKISTKEEFQKTLETLQNILDTLSGFSAEVSMHHIPQDWIPSNYVKKFIPDYEDTEESQGTKSGFFVYRGPKQVIEIFP